MEFLVQFAIGNVFVSLLLAGIAYAVHRQGRVPFLAHLLWVLVLAKLLTPPLLMAPLLPGPSAASAGIGQASAPDGFVVALVAAALLVWAIGSVLVLAVSALRIRRFDRLVARTSTPAPLPLQWLAADVGGRLGMRRVPTIYLTSARISPMTWWVGRAVRVVLPVSLPQALDSDQLRMVLAHELGHVKRRDHLVRWLEWLACVAFWWNPLVWFARHNLRIDEETACDALVVQRLGSGARPYGAALLAVVEHLARPDAVAPAVATGMDGGSLEKRFRLIVAERGVIRPPRWLVPAMLATSLLVLLLGVGQAGGALESGSGSAPTWVAGENVPSVAERAFIGSTPAAPSVTVIAADEAPTAKLSATIKPGGKKATNAKKTNAAKKKQAAKKKRAARKARQARRAARAAEASSAD